MPESPPVPAAAPVPGTPSHPPLLTVEGVAARCRVATRSVRRWIACGELPAHRLGRAVRVAEEDLARFLRRARQ